MCSADMTKSFGYT